MRPIHTWSDGLTQVGLPWEIYRLPDHTNNDGATFDLYTKSGDLPGFSANFAVDRAAGYGVVVLVTGAYSGTDDLTVRIAEEYLHPAFQNASVGAIQEAYAGMYKSENNEAVVSLRDGALWADKVVVNGTDILANFNSGVGGSAALWTTGRQHEFRCV